MVRFSCESTIRVFYCCCSVTKSCLTVCDLMDCSMPGFFVLCYLSEFVQIHVHELLMLSNHLILCCPLLLLPSIFPRIRVFSNESALGWQDAKRAENLVYLVLEPRKPPPKSLFI